MPFYRFISVGFFVFFYFDCFFRKHLAWDLALEIFHVIYIECEIKRQKSIPAIKLKTSNQKRRRALARIGHELAIHIVIFKHTNKWNLHSFSSNSIPCTISIDLFVQEFIYVIVKNHLFLNMWIAFWAFLFLFLFFARCMFASSWLFCG